MDEVKEGVQFVARRVQSKEDRVRRRQVIDCGHQSLTKLNMLRLILFKAENECFISFLELHYCVSPSGARPALQTTEL